MGRDSSSSSSGAITATDEKGAKRANRKRVKVKCPN